MLGAHFVLVTKQSHFFIKKNSTDDKHSNEARTKKSFISHITSLSELRLSNFLCISQLLLTTGSCIIEQRIDFGIK